MGPTATALAGFAAWFLLLTFILGFYRTGLVLSGRKQVSFAPDGSDVPPIGRRLNRARDNCYETLPLFAALALAAFMSGKTAAVTDPLAPYVLYARIGQSLTHIASTSAPAIYVRFTLFSVQAVIYLIWVIGLLG